ncbi:MAG: efflux RND transporter periplasmic adaptor subunit [Pirellulaceae bacterium]|nr:efflux RND transporter periplasmic adaptor subunit [Pirellulaceae bacterium]
MPVHEKLWNLLPVLRQKVLYALTIAALVGVLWMGHQTHWNPLGHLGANAHAAHQSPHSGHGDSEQLAQATTEPARESGDIVALPDTALAKAGIELGRVERRALSQTLVASGVVAYNHNLRAQLATRVPGNVWRIEKRAGEQIRKGDVLAIIEASDVGQAKGDLLQAIVESELKATNFERIKMIKEGVAERQIREAQADARQAHIRAQVAVQALVNLGLPLTLGDLAGLADDERARRLQFLGLPPAIVKSLDPRTTTANLLPLFAPFDGVVIGRDLAIGEVVTPNEPQFEIADIRTVWVLLEIPKEHVNLLRLGQTLSFTPDGFGGEVHGRIDWISTEVDEKTRTLQVRAEVNNPLGADANAATPTWLLRAHTYGTGRIVIRDNNLALIVPSDAVQFDGGGHHVFVRDGQQFRRVAVRPGTVADDMTEIEGDVEPGAVVATLGSHVLKAQLQIAAATR